MLLIYLMKSEKRYVKSADAGLFDRFDRLSQIDKMGDPLANLDAVMNWDIFQPVLDSIPEDEPKGAGGRPPFHPMFMFKILVIQSLYGLHDEQTQFQILDRRSFARFLAITDADTVPDQNTIREFREKLTKANLFDKLFAAFDSFLTERGFITRKGNMVDASFVEVPRQRNRRDENAAIKRGEVPEGWEKDPKRMAHKDLDARWTKKNNETFYGYKNHVNVDLESKLITRTVVTDASVHDSQALDNLTEEGDPPTWLDAGYAGAPCAEILHSKNITGHVCEKGSRNKPLTKSQKRSNRKKSRKRSRVEHVFGFMTGTMGAMYRRAVGYARNRAGIIFGNLVYNMARCEQIVRLRSLGRRTPQLG
jgi:IS5 family transposase